MPLKYKKFILTIVAFVLIGGNLARITVNYTDSGDTFDSPAYAQVSLSTDFTLPPEVNYDYMGGKNKEIDARIKHISIDQRKVGKVRNYLAARGAPLAAEAETFVEMADKYNLPYNIMPAISVIESGGGKNNYRPYNYAGMGGQGNAMTFKSYREAIEKHAQILRYGYFDAGANTPAKIAPYYCPPCTTWHTKVQSVMNQIEAS